MSTVENKAIVRRFVEEVFDRGDLASVEELVDDGFVPHTWPTVTGKDDFKPTVVRMASAIRDGHHTIDDMIAEGDRVAVRLTSHGTHTGDFMGVPAAGKEYTIEEQHIFRIVNGRVVEHWHVADMLGMMRQIGALPVPQKSA
jgi:steroid delta-isomerase-like uncharacterized protein